MSAHILNKLVHEWKRLSIRRLHLIAYSVGAILGILLWDTKTCPGGTGEEPGRPPTVHAHLKCKECTKQAIVPSRTRPVSERRKNDGNRICECTHESDFHWWFSFESGFVFNYWVKGKYEKITRAYALTMRSNIYRCKSRITSVTICAFAIYLISIYHQVYKHVCVM